MAEPTSNPILLVNDHVPDQRALEAALQSLGVTVLKARSAEEGLRVVEQTPIALAVVDVRMPQMDGIEMVRLLRRTRDKNSLPVILVSAREISGADLTRIYEMGAADFLALPVAPEVLRGRVGILLELQLQTQRAEMRATEIKQVADAALAAQHQRFQLLAESASDYALFFTDAEGIITDWPFSAEQLFGFTAHDAVGQSAAMIFTPEDREIDAPEAEMKKAREEGQAADDRFHLRKDGRRFPVTGRLVALRNRRGQLNGFAKIVRDATALHELQESERKFRQIFDTAHEGIWILDAEARIEIVNARMAEMLGYTAEEMVGRTKFDFAFADDRREIERIFAERRAGKSGTFELRFRHRNGDAVWMLMSGRPRYRQGAFSGALDMFNDITARRIAEERFRLFFESSAAGHVLVDPVTHRFLAVNRRFCEIVERTREELLQLTFSEVTHPDDRRADETRFADLYRGQVSEVIAQKRYVRPDGAIVWVHLTSTLIKHEKEAPKLQLTVVQDITELKRVEAELTESRTRLRLAIDAADLGVFFRDGRTGEDIWNDHAKRMLGVPLEAKESLDLLFQHVHPEDLAKVQAEAARLLNPSNKAEEFGVDFRVVWRDGTTRHLSALGITQPPEDGRSGVQVVGTVRDITAMKDVEQELRRKVAERTLELEEKTKQLESFCYTVAHDLRAPLRSINGYAELLIDESGSLNPESKLDYLERIKAATRRLDALIRDLLAYSRITQIDVSLEPVNLASACEVALAELRPEIERRAAIVRVPRTPAFVQGEKTIVEQVVINLLSNALKFTRPGEKPEVDIALDERDGWIRLNVRDRGIGIEPAYHARIFKVFERLQVSRDYSGTGIGLAIVAKGMERIGGRAGVESAAGRGSTFWIELRKAAK